MEPTTNTPHGVDTLLKKQEFPPLPTVRTSLFPTEVEFFQKNPSVSGMAAEDNRVILNPSFSGNKNAVIQNEQARILFRTGMVPRPLFQITDKQRKFFIGTPYEGNDVAMRETIAARILSGDFSFGIPTKDQLEFVNKNLTGVFR